MAASKQEIDRWFDRGVAEGASHLIVVCDRFEYEDYPVFVQPGESANQKAAEYNSQSMQRVMEIYDLGMDKSTQLNAHRVWNA